MRDRFGIRAAVLALLVTACGGPSAAASGATPTPASLATAAASPSPAPSYQPGPNSASGRVVRLTPIGVVIDEAGTEIEVDLRSAVSVWKETSVSADAIEVGDDLWVNGSSGAGALVARYVYANMGRLDGIVLAFDGRQLVIALQKWWIETPTEVKVDLSEYVEIERLSGGAREPADRSDLKLGTPIGMVTYRPRAGPPRATKVWLSAVPSAAPSPGPLLTRPVLGPATSVLPVAGAAAADAGALVIHFGGTWWYYGPAGAVAPGPSLRQDAEHASPAGRLTAVERFVPTAPGGAFQIAKELAIRESGVERVLYRAPRDGFYWSGWSPDGRYVALWEIDTYSGSLDMDGRTLVAIDVETGRRIALGTTLLYGTTAWAPPHTLAFIDGPGRMPWDRKTLRLWSPEDGIRTVTGPGVAAFSPAWSQDGRSLFFIAGPDGTWDPLAAAAGRGVGDRRIEVWDAKTGSIRALAHEPGYVEEGVRPSRDGARLLVLRRRIATAADVGSIPRVDLEVWLTDPAGAHGAMLVRFPGAGLNAYGYPMGPTEWEWSK